jgi:hypothetical protein
LAWLIRDTVLPRLERHVVLTLATAIGVNAAVLTVTKAVRFKKASLPRTPYLLSVLMLSWLLDTLRGMPRPRNSSDELSHTTR